eukprot:1400382-Pyramimonas_sp.AAC.1
METISESGSYVCGELVRAGLTVSGMTVLVASSAISAGQVCKRLRDSGVPVAAEGEAVDLGINVAAGRVRHIKTMNDRLVKARGRVHVARRMRRRAERRGTTASLWSMGARPQSTCGHQAYG